MKMHWEVEVEVLRALTADWTVRYWDELPTARHPGGGEVRAAWVEKGDAAAALASERRRPRDGSMVKGGLLWRAWSIAE
jgi:hypothetical protein